MDQWHQLTTDAEGKDNPEMYLGKALRQAESGKPWHIEVRTTPDQDRERRFADTDAALASVPDELLREYHAKVLDKYADHLSRMKNDPEKHDKYLRAFTASELKLSGWLA